MTPHKPLKEAIQDWWIARPWYQKIGGTLVVMATVTTILVNLKDLNTPSAIPTPTVTDTPFITFTPTDTVRASAIFTPTLPPTATETPTVKLPPTATSTLPPTATATQPNSATTPPAMMDIHIDLLVNGSDELTFYFKQTTDLTLLQVDNYKLVNLFQNTTTIEAGNCLRLIRESNNPSKPLRCNDNPDQDPEYLLSPSDIFWYDDANNRSRTLEIKYGNVPSVFCDTNQNQCNITFTVPIPTVTPTLTLTPSPTVTPTPTATPTLTLTPSPTDDLTATSNANAFLTATSVWLTQQANANITQTAESLKFVSIPAGSYTWNGQNIVISEGFSIYVSPVRFDEYNARISPTLDATQSTVEFVWGVSPQTAYAYCQALGMSLPTADQLYAGLSQNLLITALDKEFIDHNLSIEQISVSNKPIIKDGLTNFRCVKRLSN